VEAVGLRRLELLLVRAGSPKGARGSARGRRQQLHPEDIEKAKLKGQCTSDSRSSNVSITQKWLVKCGGKKLTVYVEAEGDRGEKDSVYDDFEDGTLQWSVAAGLDSPGWLE